MTTDKGLLERNARLLLLLAVVAASVFGIIIASLIG